MTGIIVIMAFWGAPDTVGPDTALVPGCQVLTYGEYRRLVHEKKDSVMRVFYSDFTQGIIHYFVERSLSKNPRYFKLWAIWMSQRYGYPIHTRPILQNAPPKVHGIDTLACELFYNPTYSSWNAAMITYYAWYYNNPNWFKLTRKRYITPKIEVFPHQ